MAIDPGLHLTCRLARFEQLNDAESDVGIGDVLEDELVVRRLLTSEAPRRSTTDEIRLFEQLRERRLPSGEPGKTKPGSEIRRRCANFFSGAPDAAEPRPAPIPPAAVPKAALAA